MSCAIVLVAIGSFIFKKRRERMARAQEPVFNAPVHDAEEQASTETAFAF